MPGEARVGIPSEARADPDKKPNQSSWELVNLKSMRRKPHTKNQLGYRANGLDKDGSETCGRNAWLAYLGE